MKTEYKKELKSSIDLSVGDNISVGGLICTVNKVETVFHRTPDSRVRISLTLVGETLNKNDIILFLPHGTAIEILK